MNIKLEHVLPADIEKRSFEIISAELAERGIIPDPETEMITKRVIHTTADFDYAGTLYYSRNAVKTAGNLLLNGADVVTDTRMAFSGINKSALSKLGGTVHCFIGDEDVALEAKTRGITRSAICMEKARRIDKPVIFAIGNAPTALIRLREMMDEDGFRPAFIIGVPVGFVNVEYAKELIIEADVPCIVNRGRKGGSNVAAAICNALIYGLTRTKE